MSGPAVLDELMANAWPPRVVEAYGGWRYRWADGVTRRANSALALGAAGRVEDLVEHAEAFYGRRGAPPRIQVSTASAPPELVPSLAARGYRPTARTLVTTARARDVVDRPRSTLDLEITESPTDDWFRTYWSVEATRGRSDADAAVCRDVLLVPGLPTAFVAARRGSDVLGVGQVVFERGWGGVQCMATDTGHRRHGVARAVLDGLAAEALRRDVGRMYLAVLADNTAATALYANAGFTATHEYAYFTGRTA